MRCKEHFQGDRCKKHAGHESAVALEPDKLHEGSFNSWFGSGEYQRKFMQSQAPLLKRDRDLERFIRDPIRHRPNNPKVVMDQLMRYAKYQRSNTDNHA